MQSSDKIKDIFSAKLANFEPSAPQGVWNRISDSLSAGAVKQPVVRKVALRRIVALASGVAAMLAVALLMLHYNNKVETLAENPAEGSPNKSQTEIRSEKARAAGNSETGRQLNQQTSSASQLYAKALVQPNRQASTATKPSDEPEKYAPVDDYSKNTAQPQETADEPLANTGKNEAAILKEKLDAFEKSGQDASLKTFTANTKRRSGNSKGLTVSVSGSTGFSELVDKRTPVPSIFLRYAAAASETGTQNLQEKRDIWGELQVNTEHSQPVSFGLKVNKRLNDWFSIETGLVCTYLSSKLKPAGLSSYRAEGSQKFYYIGLPVSLNYTFVHIQKAELQLAFGGMVQKDISGKIDGNQEFKNRYFDRISNKIKQDNPQLSIMSNIGVTYPLYKAVNAYATVGGAYYFDAKNEYRTVYSDKKLQLDLNVGIKLKF